MQALLRAFLCISIHAPRTGSDCAACVAGNEPGNFNPRSPHGERRKSYSAFNAYQRISIHAPRTGSDGLGVTGFSLARNFNPRSPHGERLVVTDAETGEMLVKDVGISIHAPRTGSDDKRPTQPSLSVRFQSTLPARGATWIDWNNSERLKQFQSTLPARGATTGSSSTSMRRRLFQSTLPARGATMLSLTRFSSKSHFNPRSPHGERRTPCRQPSRLRAISIHAPRTGSDVFNASFV